MTATDTAGNVSATSDGLDVTVDTTVPDAPHGLALADGSDTGASVQDGITDDATPTITGVAAPGSHVTLSDSDGLAVLGTAVADAGTGAFAIISSALAEGAHALTVKAEDLAGTTSAASAALDVTIDTAPPAAPVIDTVEGDAVTGGFIAPIDVIGTAEAGTTVLLHVDGDDAAAAQDTVGEDGEYDLSLDTLDPGDHALTVVAVDTAGNVSQASLPTSVTIAGAPATTLPPTDPEPGSPDGTPLTTGVAADGYIAGGHGLRGRQRQRRARPGRGFGRHRRPRRIRDLWRRRPVGPDGRHRYRHGPGAAGRADGRCGRHGDHAADHLFRRLRKRSQGRPCRTPSTTGLPRASVSARETGWTTPIP